MYKSILISTIILSTTLSGLVFHQGGPEHVLPEPDSLSEDAAMSFTLRPCDYKPGKKKVFDAECGTLTVPENWDQSNSREISLPIVRIPATGSKPQEPVFWLQGGPGYSNLSWSPPDWLLENHDVILVGYRGADGSTILDCPELSKSINNAVGKGIFTAETQEILSIQAQACAHNLQEEGYDLNDYTVRNVVQDIEAARIALGYNKINLYSVSYGTRVAQIYTYLYPDSLNSVVMIGLNTPGHFIYNRDDLDTMIMRMSELYQSDPQCETGDYSLAEAIYSVNREMPDHWLFLPIDPGTVRLGTHMMFFSTNNVAMPADMYLRAANGDPSGLAMMTLMAKYVFPSFVWGDLYNKGSNLDRDSYQGQESINLGDSILGAPLSELIWPVAEDWPVGAEDDYFLQLHETDVNILVANGTLDFSTPPSALEEAKPYWHNAQFVLLPEFSHVDDVEKLQPAAFERMITSFYNTGEADSSEFTQQPIEFSPSMSLTTLAKMVVAAIILIPPLLLVGIFFVIRGLLRKSRKQTH